MEDLIEEAEKGKKGKMKIDFGEVPDLPPKKKYKPLPKTNIEEKLTAQNEGADDLLQEIEQDEIEKQKELERKIKEEEENALQKVNTLVSKNDTNTQTGIPPASRVSNGVINHSTKDKLFVETLLLNPNYDEVVLKCPLCGSKIKKGKVRQRGLIVTQSFKCKNKACGFAKELKISL